MSAKNEFIDLLKSRISLKLNAVERAIFEAFRDEDGEKLFASRKRFRELRDFKLDFENKSRNDLAALWPEALLDEPCPKWFSRPENDALKLHVVDLSKAPEQRELTEEEKKRAEEQAPPDIDAIIARRREKAIEEDKERPAALAREEVVRKRISERLTAEIEAEVKKIVERVVAAQPPASE